MAGIEVQIRLKPVPASTWNASDTIIFRNDLRFVFNHIHGTTTTNAKLYCSIEPFVSATFGGQNVTVMAYGQTGSGKTHTMLGNDFDKGFIPRAAESLIALAKSEPGASVRGSCIEIYNDSLRDLLNVDRTVTLAETASGVTVDRSWLPMRTPSDFVILSTRAENNRRYGETDMNEHSSRSHTILAFEVVREHCRAIINFVDLAGSECTAKSNTAGQQLREGNFINKSLLALGNVVDAIVEGRGHIPYRECKLTRVLRPCLGGKSLAYILTCVNTSSENVTETTAALRFAQRAMKIKNDPTLTLTAPPLVANTLFGDLSTFASSSEAEAAAFARGIQDTYTYCLPGIEQIVASADREAQSLKDEFTCLQLAAFAAEKKRGLDRLAEAQDAVQAHSQTLSEALQGHEAELKRLRDRERAFAESEAKLARSEHDTNGLARSLERREEFVNHELRDLQDELLTPCLQLELFELNTRLAVEMEERQIYVSVIEDFAAVFDVDPAYDNVSSLQLITRFRDEIRERRNEVNELEDAAELYYNSLPSGAVVEVPTGASIDVEERVFQLQAQERKLDNGIKDALRSTSRSQKSVVPTRRRAPVSPSPSPVPTAASRSRPAGTAPGFMANTLRTIRNVVTNMTSPLKSPSVRTPVRRAAGRLHFDAENSESLDEVVGIATRRRLLAEQEEQRKRAADLSKSPSFSRRNIRQR